MGTIQEILVLENNGYINYGEHIGNVNFNENMPSVLPTPGQLGAMCCPRCKNTVWADSPKCVFCHFDIQSYRRKKRCKWEIARLTKMENITGGIMAVLFFAMLISVFFKNNILAFILFLPCVANMFFYNAIGDKKVELKKELKEYDYLCY
mgnify:CR=1 FL=1